MLVKPLVFSDCSRILFLIQPLPLTESIRIYSVSYNSLCSTRITHRMPCHSSGHQMLRNPSSRKAEHFPSILHMCIYSHTSLTCHQSNKIFSTTLYIYAYIYIYICIYIYIYIYIYIIIKKSLTGGSEFNHLISRHLINSHRNLSFKEDTLWYLISLTS